MSSHSVVISWGKHQFDLASALVDGVYGSRCATRNSTHISRRSTGICCAKRHWPIIPWTRSRLTVRMLQFWFVAITSDKLTLIYWARGIRAMIYANRQWTKQTEAFNEVWEATRFWFAKTMLRNRLSGYVERKNGKFLSNWCWILSKITTLSITRSNSISNGFFSNCLQCLSITTTGNDKKQKKMNIWKLKY